MASEPCVHCFLVLRQTRQVRAEEKSVILTIITITTITITTIIWKSGLNALQKVLTGPLMIKGVVR